MTVIEDILSKLGLTNDEAKTYIACLTTGNASIAKISETSGIPRSSTYLLIETLRQKGFVTQSSIGTKVIFNPLDPQKLKEIVKNKLNDITNLEKSLNLHLPQIQSLYNCMPQKPKVLYYSGYEGVRNIFEESLKAQEILVICSGYNEPVETKMAKYLDKYFELLDKNNIKTREIIGGSKDSDEYIKKYHGHLHQIKKVNFPKNINHTDKMIYGEYVAIVSFPFLNGVVIENKQIAEFEREQFEKMWEIRN